MDKREFDLILTDLMMQGQTGMELLEQVPAEPHDAPVNFIFTPSRGVSRQR